MNDKLRIGVLTDSDNIPHWAYEMLARIQGSSYAEIVLIVNNVAPRQSQTSSNQKGRHNLTMLLYGGLSRLENALFNATPDAFAPKSIRQLLPNTPCLGVKPIRQQFSDYFSDDDIQRIEAYRIDVFIRLGFRILRGDVLKSAKYGIWSYHHGDNRVNRGGPPGFWEVLEGWSETGSVLQILTEDLDGGKVLCRSYSKTDALSVKHNKNNVYWKTLSLMPRKLKELHEIGGERFMDIVRLENTHPDFYSRRLYHRPGNAELIKLAVGHYSSWAAEKLTALLYFGQWVLMYEFSESDRVSTAFWRFKTIIPPRDRFWADPFVVYEGGTYHIFMEEFIYAMNRGRISHMTLDPSGNRSEPRPIMEAPYHLSYPSVFHYNGDYYMTPETAQNRTVELYRCIEFPEKWELASTLMRDVYAVDPTVLQYDGKWWLFVNIRENEGASSIDELFLFYSSDLLSGDWRPHARNPVVSDVKSARPAGKIFSYNGNLYRPAQNNSRIYGNGIKINHIVRLSEKEYQEECVNDIEPRWDDRIIGIHTLNRVENLTIVDGLRHRAKYLF